MRSELLICLGVCTIANAGFVTVEKDATGVWWFVHDGNKFLSKGVNHVNNGGLDDGVGGRESVQCQDATGSELCGDTLSWGKGLTYAPYHNATQARWHTAQAWANGTVERLKSLGMNTLSGWSSKLAEGTASDAGLYYVHLLDIGTTWLHHGGLEHDVWTPEFVTQANEVAQREVAPRASDPHLIGYQLDNELEWGSTSLDLGSYLNLTTPGHDRAVDFLETRFGSVQALNQAWGINAASWEDVARHVRDSGLNRTAYRADSSDFLGLVAERYFNVTNQAIRRYDTNHLNLGIRGANLVSVHLGLTHPFLGLDLLRPVMMAMVPFVDVLDWHGYLDKPDGDYCGAPVHTGPALEALHNATGKPIWIGEFSFTSKESSLPNTKGARSCPTPPLCLPHCPYGTQKQRAQAFDRYVTDLVTRPFAVGYHWWQWADEPTGGRWPDGEDSNYGIVTIDDELYDDLAAQMTQTNAATDALHTAASAFIQL
eukprot:Hpha_TRINITY_DN5257_c0_g1::TRINITY_DN5257_c0_g1_i1::g.116483::m.116483